MKKNIVVLVIAYLFLLIVALIPIWKIEYLPLQDYPNHLARMHIINYIQKEPLLQKFYSVQFNILPNLAMDIIVPALSKIFPLEIAGRLMVSLIFVAMTTGSIFLNYVLFRSINFLPLMSFFLYLIRLLLKDFSIFYLELV